MNTTRLTQARKNFCFSYVPRHVQRHNVHMWVRMIRILGDKWQYLSGPTQPQP